MRQRRHRTQALSPRDLAVLALERRWGPSPEAVTIKLREAQDQLGLDAAGYALVLNALLADPAALEADPETVTALRAIRASRRAGIDALEPT